MSFTTTATSLFSPAPLRGISGMLRGWLPGESTPVVPAPTLVVHDTSSRKRKRQAPPAPKPKVQPPPVPRQYGMRKRAAAPSYAEVDSDDELINESDADADSDYDTAPRKKPKKTKPLPKREIFPLLRLPRELRDMVYAHALADSIGAVYIEERTIRYRRRAVRVAEGPQLYLADHGHYLGQLPCHDMAPWPKGDDAAPHAEALAPALLATCRQVCAEATPLLYAQPLVFQDAAALHGFLAALRPPTRALLRDVTIVGMRGSPHRSMRSAFDIAALTLLADGGATGLSALRYRDEMHRCGEGPKDAARRFYRRAFHWLEAAVRTRDVDEAVGAVQFIDSNNKLWTRDHAGSQEDYWKELRRLVVKGLRRRR